MLQIRDDVVPWRFWIGKESGWSKLGAAVSGSNQQLYTIRQRTRVFGGANMRGSCNDTNIDRQVIGMNVFYATCFLSLEYR